MQQSIAAPAPNFGYGDCITWPFRSAEWITQEAQKQGVKVSNAQVQKQFQDQKKQSFQKEADYQKFLKNSGMTEADLIFRVKLDVISNAVRNKIIKGKDTVTVRVQEVPDAEKRLIFEATGAVQTPELVAAGEDKK